MKAYVITAPQCIREQELPVPSPGPGEALVRVRAVGVCGSDVHAYEGTQPFFQYPQIPGHEVVGEIVAISEKPASEPQIPGRTQAPLPRVGDRVTLDPSLPCGRCYACRLGRYNCCAHLRVMGVHAPGAMREYFTAPLPCLYVLPDALEEELGVLAEPLSIGVQATKRARLQAGERCLIMGAGTIGLCVLLVAKAQGALCAISDVCAERLKLAQRLGADLTIHPPSQDIQAALEDFTQGDGPAVVIEAVGRPETVALAAELVAPAGRVVQLGLCSQPICFPGNIFVKKEMDWLGSRLHGGTMPQAIRLLAAGAIHPQPLITHRLPLAALPQALQLLAKKPQEAIKIILRP